MNVKKRYWLWVAGWLALIYSTLYIVRPLNDFLQERIPFNATANGLIIVVLFALIIGYWVRFGIPQISSIVFFGIIVAVYLYGLSQIRYPAEKIHFLEYGFLAYLLYRALRVDVGRLWGYGLALILSGIFGWIDEGIQHLLPNRYYELVDVRLNVISAFLALILIFIFERDQQLKKA